MSKFRCEYVYCRPYETVVHAWKLIGAAGGLHLHISDREEELIFGRYSGNLEFHYRAPPNHLKTYAPNDDRCWLLGCPCWHDGTSVYASDFLIPFWLVEPNNHDRMFISLAHEYTKKFGGED